MREGGGFPSASDQCFEARWVKHGCGPCRQSGGASAEWIAMSVCASEAWMSWITARCGEEWLERLRGGGGWRPFAFPVSRI